MNLQGPMSSRGCGQLITSSIGIFFSSLGFPLAGKFADQAIYQTGNAGFLTGIVIAILADLMILIMFFVRLRKENLQDKTPKESEFPG